MAITKWDLTDRVGNRIKDKPSALGSAVIVEFIEDASQDVENYTGLSIDLTNVGSSYIGVLTDISTLYSLNWMSNVGISYKLGRTSIDKRTEIDGLSKQQTILEAKVQRKLNMLGKRIKQSVYNP